MSSFISLEQAVTMTTLYRQQKENILADQYKNKNILSICETFVASQFQTLINKPDCQSLRIYFGMSEDLKIHAIIVAVNSNNEDILPAMATSASATVGEDDIIEEGLPCPPICPTASPLNG